MASWAFTILLAALVAFAVHEPVIGWIGIGVIFVMSYGALSHWWDQYKKGNR